MSVTAQHWAWAQNLPDRPKFVLVTFGDQADSQTGHVRYQRSDTEFFVKKTGLTERSFYRCVAALVRHGYIKRESGRGRNREAQYWLCLDREPTELEAWNWAGETANEPDNDPQDVGGAEDGAEAKSASVADQNVALVCQNGGDDVPSLADHKESFDSPKRPAEKAGKIFDESKKGGFSRQAQSLEVDASRKAAAPPNLVFVIEGTRAWDAWLAYRRGIGRPINGSYRGEGEHRGKTGKHFPTLFPPKSEPTGPPSSPTMTEADEEFVANGGVR